MTNGEKYLKEDIVVRNLINEFADFCARQINGKASSERLEQFLSKEATPTLTEDERVILRNITYDSEYKYIYRSLGMLYVSENEKLTCVDRLPAMHHLFQFIKERRRI